MKKLLLCTLIGLSLTGCGDKPSVPSDNGQNVLASSEATADNTVPPSNKDSISVSEPIEVNEKQSSATQTVTPYEACVQKGIAYYKEIGSYPRLTSENISAEEKSRQNCSRSLVAFGN